MEEPSNSRSETSNDISIHSKNSIGDKNSTKNTQLLTVVITWIANWSTPLFKEELINWFSSKNLKEESLHQLHFQQELHSLLPVLLNSNNDVTFVDKHKRTLLHYCILLMKSFENVAVCDKQHDKILVSSLCKLGALIIANDNYGHSPLGIALVKKRMDLVETLVRLDCSSATDCNELGQTALHILVDKYSIDAKDYKKYKNIIGDLIYGKEADLNKTDKNGVTPVHLAAKSFDVKLLKMFKRSGADLQMLTNAGDDLLILACRNITKHTDESVALQLISWLLDRKLNVNTKNNNDLTALHYASQSTKLSVIETLVAAGADLHAVAIDGSNPLHSATISSSFEVMQYFVERGVDFYRIDNVYGFKLLHAAAISVDERKCEWLMKNGFDPNDFGNCALTPLHLASMLGNVKVVEKLIECGADVHCRDKKHQYTALHLASMRGQFATIDRIEKTGDDFSLVRHCYKNLGLKTDKHIDYKATCDALLNAGADVNVKDDRGRTPLHHATRQTTNNLVEVLLKAGAHVDVQDDAAFTPLHHSLLNGNPCAVKRLLIYGADINDIEHPCESVLRRCRGYILSRTSLVRYLLKLKAAGLPVGYDLEPNLHKHFDLKIDYSKYALELMYFKARMLSPEISLHDLLHMNFKRRVIFANNLSDDLETRFPYCYILIKNKCNEAVNRIPLLEPAKNAFCSLTGLLWPDLCVDRIFSFLNNRHLRVLTETFIDSESSTILNEIKKTIKN